MKGTLALPMMQLLLGPEEVSRRAADTVAAGEGWSAVVELSRQWKVVAGLETRLGKMGVVLPAEARVALEQLTSRFYVQSSLSLRAGVMAMMALESAGIACAGFKGLATLAYLYPGPRYRTLQDVDVLVRSEQVEDAVRVLEGIGLKRSVEGEWEKYVQFVKHSPGAAGNEAVSLTDAQGGAVDLHWRLGAMDVETLLGGVRRVKIQSQTVPAVSPGHSMMLTVHHALRNDLAAKDIARDVCDFAAWQVLLGETGELDAVMADAQRLGLKPGCLALEGMVAELRGTEVALRASRSESRDAMRLAELYLRQLQGEELNTDLAYLGSAKPLLQMMGGAAAGWGQYRSYMQKVEKAGGEASLTVVERLWEMVRAAARLSPRQWLQVRALAKAKDRFSGE